MNTKLTVAFTATILILIALTVTLSYDSDGATQEMKWENISDSESLDKAIDEIESSIKNTDTTDTYKYSIYVTESFSVDGLNFDVSTQYSKSVSIYLYIGDEANPKTLTIEGPDAKGIVINNSDSLGKLSFYIYYGKIADNRGGSGNNTIDVTGAGSLKGNTTLTLNYATVDNVGSNDPLNPNSLINASNRVTLTINMSSAVGMESGENVRGIVVTTDDNYTQNTVSLYNEAFVSASSDAIVSTGETGKTRVDLAEGTSVTSTGRTAIILNNGEVESDGTIKGELNGVEISAGILDINKGSVIGGTAAIVASEGITGQISGGVFSSDVDELLFTSGYSCELGTDGLYHASYLADDAKASVGEVRYKTLSDAFHDAVNGDTIVLLNDITNEGLLVLNDGRSLTIDLNSHNLTFNKSTIEYECMELNLGSLKVTGTGTVTGTEEIYGAFYIDISENVDPNDDNVHLIIDSGVKVRGCNAVFIDQDVAYGVTVDIYGDLQSNTGSYAVYIQGNNTARDGNTPEINVYKGATVSGGDSAPAMYIPAYANVNIMGGTITGGTGIEMRNGNLTVSGENTTISSTAKTYTVSETPIGGGSTVVGAAIAISPYNGLESIGVDISEGSFSGPIAFAQAHSNNSYVMPEKFDFSISGGTFTSTGTDPDTNDTYPSIVTVEGDVTEKFVTGGTFKSGTEPDTSVTDYMNGAYTVDEYGTVQIDDEGAVLKVGDQYFSDFMDAFSQAVDGDVNKIELQKDCTVDSKVSLGANANVIIDLAGNTITVTASGIGFELNGTDAYLEIIDSSGDGKILFTGPNNNFVVAWGALKLDGISVESGVNTANPIMIQVGADGYAHESHLIVTEGTELCNSGTSTNFGMTFIALFNSSAQSTVDYAGIMSAGNPQTVNAGIYVNGTVTGSPYAPTINVTGGVVDGGKAHGIYGAGCADYNVSGGKITGISGIEIRAGTLEITGNPEITATGEFNAGPNDNGSSITGAALAVSQHVTDNNIDVDVSGGTFTGVKAFYQASLEGGNNPDIVKIAVSGGTFNGDFESKDLAGFVTGGTFSNEVDQRYCAPGHTSSVNDDGKYIVTEAKPSSSLTVSDETPSQNDEVTATFTIDGASAEGATFKWTFNGKVITGETGSTYTFKAERSGTLTVEVTIDVYGIEKTFTGSVDITVTVPTTPEDPEEGETTVTIDKDGNTVTETTRPDGSSTVTTEKPAYEDTDGNTITESVTVDKDNDGSTTTTTETKYESDSATTTVTEVEDASGNTTVQSQTSVKVDETQDVAVVKEDAITAAIDHMESVVADTTAEKVVTVETSKEQVTLPANISDVTDAGATLEVVSKIGTVKVGSDVVDTLTSDNKDVTITQKDADTTEMNASQQQAVGGNRVIELTASNDDRNFHQLGGTVEVVVRNYALPDGVDADSVLVFYVDDNGRLSQKETTYDADTGLLRFWTDHFSYYVIGNTSMIAQEEPDDKPVNPGWNPGQDDDVWIPPTVVVEESGSQSGTTEIVACAAAAVVAALMAAFLIIERRKS